MLNTLRQSAGSWIAQIFIGLLVLSFAVWGINDIFTGQTATAVATVGDTEISATDYQRELQIELRREGRERGQPLDMATARMLGLPSRVLGQMLGRTALDGVADEMGLAVSDETIAKEIRNDPLFTGPFGNFDRSQFQQILFQSGVSEDYYIEEQRSFYVREQLLSGVTTGAALPKSISDTIYQYQWEERRAEFITVPPDAVGEIGAPTEDQLAAFHQEQASLFTAPEYRAISYIVIDDQMLVDTVEVTDEELQSEYDYRLEEFTTPEKRVIDQLPFSDRAEAEKAAAMIAEGTSFEDVAAAFGIDEDTYALGELEPEQILTEEIRVAAFSLDEGAISDPVDGPLGTVILRVRSVTPGSEKSLDEVRDELRDRVAQERATDELFELVNQIEDERAGGATLEEIATSFNLPMTKIDRITAQGLGEDGERHPQAPAARGILADAFAGEIGEEISLGETDSGDFYLVEVDDIIPPALRPLETVRAEVTEEWKRAQRQTKLRELVLSYVEKGNNGTPFETIGEELGRAVQSTPPINRRMSNEVFSRLAVANLFSTEEGKFTWGPVGFGESLLILKVKEIIKPEISEDEPKVAETAATLNERLTNELIEQFVRASQEELGVSVNNRLVEQIAGAGDGSGL